MKNYPLSFQIWAVISLITLLISGILILILPHTLRDFFTEETYNTIETAQQEFFSSIRDNMIIPNMEPKSKEDNNTEYYLEKENPKIDTRVVRHFYVFNNGSLGGNLEEGENLPVNFLLKVQKEALNQEETSKKYSGEVNGEKIFYIISKGIVKINMPDGKTLKVEGPSLVSYLNDSYREGLVKTLFKKLAKRGSLILIISWIPAILLARYISKPLVNLEEKVEKLAHREWEEPINIKREDEIGKLASSIDELRLELIRQDKAEQSFLQNISHELKTPTMVIRSYIEAIKDGIYPRGTLESSLEVIDEETIRLEEKIESLLYLTKLDYLSKEQPKMEDFYLNELILDIIKRIKVIKPEITIEFNLEDVLITADPEQINTLIENILDNALRYAKEKIIIDLIRIEDSYKLEIWNDGPKIDDKNLNMIFKKFHKGRDGVLGLGLSIAKRVVDIHGYNLKAKNKSGGVSFIIEFSSNKNVDKYS